MSGTSINSGIRDNHTRGSVAEFLRAKIQPGSRLSVVSAYFTIYAYEALRDRLDHIEHLDFLFGEPRFIASLDPDKTEKKAFILDGNGLHLANHLTQKRVAHDCADSITEDDRRIILGDAGQVHPASVAATNAYREIHCKLNK